MFFSATSLVAQEDDQVAVQETPEVETPPAPKRYYVLSPRVSVTVPHPTKNTSFKKSFVGIYEASGGLNLYVYKGIFVGGTYKNGLLKITENKINDYNASLTINNIGVKLGGDVYVGEKNKVIFSAAVTAGQSTGRYTGLVAKDKSRILPTKYTCNYFEPEINLFFLIESNFGIGATLSYSVFDKTFDPYELALNDWTQFPKSITGSTQFYSFGFGFYYSLWKKKKGIKNKRVDNNG
ncbi:MAG: hypothetical protein K0Q95_793 [Bacteroidota bacterium]|jgi:hypothetical protein|nr:hypothetical protein [Bacteroidota bacterium]